MKKQAYDNDREPDLLEMMQLEAGVAATPASLPDALMQLSALQELLAASQQQATSLEANLNRERAKTARQAAELKKLRPKPPEPPPTNFQGWGVKQVGKYIHLQRRIDAKVVNVYIGRRWDEQTAKAKLDNWELKSFGRAK